MPDCPPALYPLKDTGRDGPASELRKGAWETDADCGRDRGHRADAKSGPASPGQPDVVPVVLAPLPALSRVHSKMQGQQLVLCIGKWDHSCGGRNTSSGVSLRGAEGKRTQANFTAKEAEGERDRRGHPQRSRGNRASPTH